MKKHNSCPYRAAGLRDRELCKQSFQHRMSHVDKQNHLKCLSTPGTQSPQWARAQVTGSEPPTRFQVLALSMILRVTMYKLLPLSGLTLSMSNEEVVVDNHVYTFQSEKSMLQDDLAILGFILYF